MPIEERQIGIDHLIKQAEKFSNMSAQDPTTDAIDRVQTAINLVGAAIAERLEAIQKSLDSVADIPVNQFIINPPRKIRELKPGCGYRVLNHGAL